MRDTISAIGLIGAVLGGLFVIALLWVTNAEIGTPAYTSSATSPHYFGKHDLGRGFDG
jgi:hypothetical protein